MRTSSGNPTYAKLRGRYGTRKRLAGMRYSRMADTYVKTLREAYVDIGYRPTLPDHRTIIITQTNEYITDKLDELNSSHNGLMPVTIKTHQGKMMSDEAKNSAYVRSVNDYTISAHETYSMQNGTLPKAQKIINIKDIHYEDVDKAATLLIDAIKEYSTEVLISSDFIDSVEEEEDSYCIYAQRVLRVSTGANKCVAIVDMLASPTVLCLTVLAASQDVATAVLEAIKVIAPNVTRPKAKKKDRTFYTISQTQRGFELEDLNIKSESLNNIEDNYNDDFAEADVAILETIDANKKGLILLHGIPGSGKTSYIKYLITRDSERKIVYIPTHLTTAIASPNFISFVKNELSNSVLVIEDAEQILLSRESGESHKEAVSNILNMTDGILADALNILIICTFNTDMAYIDSALTRKGRLMLQYNFDKLSAVKTNALTMKLYGKNSSVAMTLADIYNLEYDLIKPEAKKAVAFGFQAGK